MNIEWKISPKPLPYPDAINFMEKRVDKIITDKQEDLIWLLEHQPVYTAGSSANKSELINPQFPVYEAGRGGKYTYHGPGQRVVYLAIDLKKLTKKPDIRKYVWNLEQWIINSLQYFDITGERRDGRVGIWVQNNNSEAKIAAVGVRIRKWVAYHGISINVNPNLEHFNGIIPCGIKEYGVTSIEQLTGLSDMNKLDSALKEEFHKVFLNKTQANF